MADRAFVPCQPSCDELSNLAGRACETRHSAERARSFYAGFTRRGLRVREASPPPSPRAQDAKGRTPMARDRAARSRRQFVRGGLAVAGVGLLAGCGVLSPRAPQPTKVVRLGHLEAGSPTAVVEGNREALREGLREHGYVEGQNL